MEKQAEKAGRAVPMSPQELVEKIEEMLPEFESQGERMVIAMDGMCGSGKTTLAARLAQRFGGQVVHMDDFYLPVELRTQERRSEPGGNVHYERFLVEAMPYLKGQEAFCYGKFSDEILDIAEEITIEPGSLLIVEGAYSMRPELRNAYDLTVCVLSPTELQRQRLIRREGEEGYLEYRDLWIPLETAYLDHYDIEHVCDVVLNAVDLQSETE